MAALTIQILRVDYQQQVCSDPWVTVRTGKNYAWGPITRTRVVGVQQAGTVRFADFAGDAPVTLAVKDATKDVLQIEAHETRLLTSSLVAAYDYPLQGLPINTPTQLALQSKDVTFHIVATAHNFGTPSKGQTQVTVVQSPVPATMFVQGPVPGGYGTIVTPQQVNPYQQTGHYIPHSPQIAAYASTQPAYFIPHATATSAQPSAPPQGAYGAYPAPSLFIPASSYQTQNVAAQQSPAYDTHYPVLQPQPTQPVHSGSPLIQSAHQHNPAPAQLQFDRGVSFNLNPFDGPAPKIL